MPRIVANDAELQLFDGGHLFMIQDKRAYRAIVEWLSRHGPR
jgi:surfactin synthase thioesterase subunit